MDKARGASAASLVNEILCRAFGPGLGCPPLSRSPCLKGGRCLGGRTWRWQLFPLLLVRFISYTQSGSFEKSQFLFIFLNLLVYQWIDILIQNKLVCDSTACIAVRELTCAILHLVWASAALCLHIQSLVWLWAQALLDWCWGPCLFFSMRHPPYVHVLIPAISWWPTLGISGLLRQTGQRDRCGFCGIHVVGCTYRWTLLSTYGQSANGGQKFFNRIPVIIFTFLKTTEGLDICFKWFVILPQRIKLKKMYLQKNIHHLKKLE